MHVTTTFPGDDQPVRVDVSAQHLVVLAKGKLCITGRVRSPRNPWMTPADALDLAAALTRVASGIEDRE